jgi:hypothetical protein
MFNIITINPLGSDQISHKPLIENRNSDKPIINIQKINFDPPAIIFQDDPPKEVIADYTNDLNILKIHDAIKIIIGHKLSLIPKLKNEISILTKQINSNSLTFVDINAKNCLIDKCRKEIYDLESGILWQSYIEKAKPLLLEYLPLAGDEIKGIITIQTSKKNKEDPQIISQRLNIIHKYLLICESYIKLNLHFIIPSITNCPICDEPVSNWIENEEGITICKCGYEKILPYSSQSYNDANRIDVCNKNNYDDISSFIKRMDAFEGKQDYKLPRELFNQLNKYFISKDLPSSEEIKMYPLLPSGKKEKTSIKLLIEGLYSTNNPTYYKDLEVIAHELWGWKLGCLDNYREDMIKDYKDTQMVYEKIKQRESSLNINLRLFWHLKARGYPCEYEDFKSITSQTSIEYHITMFKEMCKQTGVKYTPI